MSRASGAPTPETERPGRIALVFTWLLVGGLYYLAARLSLRISLVGESVTPLWPPTGIALVATLWFGYRIWPGIAVGAFLVNLAISPNAAAAAGIAAGNTLAPLIAAAVLERVGFRKELDRLRDAVAIVFLASLPATLVSATFGTTSLVWTEAVHTRAYLETWSVWWTGDAMGMLVVAPFLLTLATIRPARVRLIRVGEAIVLYAGVGAGSLAILWTSRPVWVLLFPLLGLIAIRFRQAGAIPAALIVSAAATAAVVDGSGPFVDASLLEKMLTLQAFNAAVSFTSLFPSTLVAERMRAREREHLIAETLQRSLLPENLPDNPDVAVAARYIPATHDVEVGGDWYDIIALPDGRFALAIGDVAGHGVQAAAAMGQLRMALRAYALEALSPSHALERLNMLLFELQPNAMATLLYAHLDQDSGELSFANAGHLPPLIVGRDGGARYLEDGLAPPLGVSANVNFKEAATKIEPGTTVFLYTDGLIERRRASIDGGLEALKRAAGAAPAELGSACDYIIRSLLIGGNEDDVAVLAVRRESLAGRRLHVVRPAKPATVAQLRRVLRRWLTENGADQAESIDVLIAAGEACTNAVQHAYDASEGVVELDARIHDNEVTVIITDHGKWRPAVPTSLDESGRGLSLMRGIMDAVDIDADEEGTEVRMRRRLKAVGSGA